MATTNLGTTLGAWILGLSDSLGGLPMMFVLVFVFHSVGLVLMLVVEFPRRAADIEITEQLAEGAGPVPIKN